jgi:hypothetical protein
MIEVAFLLEWLVFNSNIKKNVLFYFRLSFITKQYFLQILSSDIYTIKKMTLNQEL